MIKSERINTEQNFKNTIIFNSLSLRNIKCGRKNNIDNEKHNSGSSTLKNLSSYNNQRLSTSESLKNKRIEKEINFEENEKKKEEEKNKRREMSYLARKKILLRLRQEDKNEEKNENKKEKIKYRKLRKFEIKIPLDKMKLKRIGSNENINFNYRNNNEYFKHNMTNFENKKGENNIFNNSGIKNVKTNFVLNGNIRYLYKNNKLKKDFKLLTEKSCKILKVQKVALDKNYNDNNVNKKVKQNFISSININNVYYNTSKKKENISKEQKEQKNNNEKKILYSDNNNLKKIKNKHSILKYIENGKNRNCFFNLKNNNNKTNDINDNNIIFSSIKNLKKVNSDFFKKQKKSEFNNNNNTIEIDESKRTINGNENRILARFSFFNYFKKKNIRNELNKDMEKLYKSSDKLKLVTNNSCKNSVRSKYKNRSIVNLRTLSINNLDLSRNNNENIYNSYLMLKSSGNEVNNEERKRIKIFNKKFYIIHFFEEIIDITNSINDRNLLKTLLNNLNIKYYLQNNYYDDKKYNNFFKENENFEYVFKHFGLVLICLIFFVNDNTLYNENNSKAKDLLIQLIYSSLNYVEIFGNKDSSKIYNFISKFKIQSKLPIRRYIISLILFLFDNKKEYIPLKNALEQLYDIIIKKDYKYLTEVLNNCILYCYNSKPKNLFSFTIFKSKSNTQISKENHEKQNNDTISHNNNNSKNKNIPPIPFIRTSMKKKFCLVLDIDETISHSLKLSFGYYFLVRPGAIYFLKEVSKYYEIIIFTSSPKNYADNILNKIDISGNLISHRLYRNHVVFENGKSVKNLNKLGRDLTKTIFIDNLRSNAKYNLHNLCSIKTWISDIFDDRLIKLKDKLIYIATCGKYDDDITQGI